MRRDDFAKGNVGKIRFGIFPATEAERFGDAGQEAEEQQPNVNFDLKPKDVKAYLDRFVVKQEEAKKVLATAICDHYNHIAHCLGEGKGRCNQYTKQNVILIGPTGVGKTYLVRTLAELVGVPFVKADATKYSETGYVGGDVEDLVRELVHKAKGNIKLAEYGIIYLDEIDKIATPANIIGRDVSGHGVQRGLLKLLEETEVSLTSPLDITSQLQAVMDYQRKGRVVRRTINTRHILFIVSGAFPGLADIVRRRIGSKQIGFIAERLPGAAETELLGMAKATDFVEYGFEAEFIGRLPVVAVCHPLSVEDLYQILKYSEGSIIKQYESAFRAYGIEVLFSDEGLRRIADKAHGEQTGARGLVSVCEKTLREYKFELPNSSIKRFVVNAELIDDPLGTLNKILTVPGYNERSVMFELLSRYEQEFYARHGVRIVFSPEARAEIVERALKQKVSPEEICNTLFKDYEHGLNLIVKQTGQEVFVIDAEFVADPLEALARRIRALWQQL